MATPTFIYGGYTAKEADASGGKFEKLGSIVKGVGVAMGAALTAIGTAAIAA